MNRDLSQGIDLEEIEDYFSLESWNVRKWGSQADIDRVFEIEAVYSKALVEDLSDASLRKELANAIRPFSIIEFSRNVVELAPAKPSFQSSFSRTWAFQMASFVL